MFRSEAQRARACCALCRQAGLQRFWTAAGPTDEAIALLETRGSPLSSGERVVLFVAWAFWNGATDASLADVIYRLDAPNLRAVATLILALDQGPHAIDQWLASSETRFPNP